MADSTKIGKILAQPDHQYLIRFTLMPITWDEGYPNDEANYFQPVEGVAVDLSQYVQDAQIEMRRQQLCATLSMTLKANMDNATMRALDYSELIVVTAMLQGSGTPESIILGHFLIDKFEPNEDPTAPGTWVLEARDTLKLMKRRRYFGTLEPSLIVEPSVSTWQDLTKVSPVGLDYYEFFDGVTPDVRTWNWATLPKPQFKVKETGEVVTPDNENMRVLFGDGLVRIGKLWYDVNIGPNTLQIRYSRYALWEDVWADPTLRLNSPRDIILDMLLWSGFRDTDSAKLCYISTIEQPTYPQGPDYVYDAGGADRASDAAGEGSGIALVPGDVLYVGVVGRRFPALHAFLKTASVHVVGPALTYSYWDGDAWVPITPDFDSSDEFRQSGIINWFDVDLSTWVKGIFNPSLPSAYWLKIEADALIEDFSATISLLYAGHPITIEPMRIDSSMDLMPADVLDKYVRPSCSPNYRWRATVDGAFEALHDILQTAAPTFTSEDVSRTSVDRSQPHDDDLKTVILYRGQARERFNAALALNGGITRNLQNSNDTNTFKFLIDGNTTAAVNLGTMPLGTTMPIPIVQIELGGSDTSLDVREVGVHAPLAESEIDITTDAAGVTWIDTNFGDLVTDASDATYERLFSSVPYWEIQPFSYAYLHQRVTFDTGQSIKKIVARAAYQALQAENYSTIYILARMGLSTWDHYKIIAAFNPSSTSPEDYTFDDLWLTGIREIMVVSASASFSWPAAYAPNLYRLQLFTATETDETGSGSVSLTGGTGSAATLVDGNTATGVTFSKLGEGWELTFASPIAEVDNLHLYAVLHGDAVIEWLSDGETEYNLGIVIGQGPLGERVYGGLGWAAVSKIRFRVTGLRTEPLELSAIEVYTVTRAEENSVDAKWLIEYTTAIDGTWRVLCSDADGASFGYPKFTIGKEAFGSELYPNKLRFTLQSWGKTDSGLFYAPLAEIKVWLGDTLWGKAILGVTPPFNTAADLTLQARMGWKTKLFPVDPTAVTQAIVNYKALQVLREYLRMSSGVHLSDVRLEARVGHTVFLPSHIVAMYDLVYAYYMVSDVVIRVGAAQTPVVELLMAP